MRLITINHNSSSSSSNNFGNSAKRPVKICEREKGGQGGGWNTHHKSCCPQVCLLAKCSCTYSETPSLERLLFVGGGGSGAAVGLRTRTPLLDKRIVSPPGRGEQKLPCNREKCPLSDNSNRVRLTSFFFFFLFSDTLKRACRVKNFFTRVYTKYTQKKLAIRSNEFAFFYPLFGTTTTRANFFNHQIIKQNFIEIYLYKFKINRRLKPF